MTGADLRDNESVGRAQSAALLQSRLGRYPTTWEQDEHLLAGSSEGLSWVGRMIVQVRQEEKALLLTALERLVAEEEGQAMDTTNRTPPLP